MTVWSQKWRSARSVWGLCSGSPRPGIDA